MRILILTPRLPWPSLDGGRVAMARLAESLAGRGAEVEILSLNPRKHHGDAAASPLPLAAIDIDTSRVIGPALRRGAPYVVARFISTAFRNAIDKTMQRFRPDVVQIEGPFLLPYVENARGARVVLRSQNVEFRIWEGLAQEERGTVRRLALRHVASSLRKYEIRHLDTPDAILPISAADAEDLRRLGCTRPMHVVPCSAPLPALSAETGEPFTVGFIGALDYRPNQEAVRWIVDELWPRVIARAPAAKLSIVGSAPPDWLKRRVGIQSNVVSANDFIRRTSVMIAPLFAGSGMRIKVLEAMALAKPVVATPIGAGGLDVQHDRDIVIADDSDTFADAVVRLLRDRERAAAIGNAARATVAARYDGDTIAGELMRFYESLLPRG